MTGHDPAAVTGLDQSFDAGGLYALRAAVAAHASAMGLDDVRLGGLMVVASELATNAIRHGGGTGRLRLWREGETLHCQVSDSGPGIADPETVGTTRVPLSADNGRGIWIVRQISDRVEITTGTTGTTITASLADPPVPAQDAGSN
jgi:anti-sigma regulatory factor (Ser/Thr protein kinase)